MVDLQVRTGFREKAAPVFTGTLSQLLPAGRSPELRCGTSHVVNISLEIRFADHLLRLPQDRFVAPDLNDPALMKGQGAEITVPVAAPVGGQAVADLPQRRHTARPVVGGMPGAHVGEGIDIVHLLHGKRLRGRILYNKSPSPVSLVQALCLKGIRIGMLEGKALRISPFARRGGLTDLLMVREADRIVNILLPAGLVHRPVDKGQIPHIQSGSQRVRDLHDTAFPHPVGDQIRARIQKDRPAYLVRPVIIMGQPPQAGLQPSEDDRCLFKGPADQVPVDHDRIVRPFSHHSPGTEGIPAAVFFVHRIMIDHRVHIPGRHQKAETGLPEFLNTGRVAPVRLAQHSHRITPGLEDTGDDRGPEAGMIHIGISAHIHEIGLPDPALFQFPPADRQKTFRHPVPLCPFKLLFW